MIEKRLYALTDGEASELRRLMDQAQSQALTGQDGVTYEDLTYLMAPLNTPLDRDAAVGRIAQALAFDQYGRDLWDSKAPGGTGPMLNQNFYRRRARVVWDALLQEDE